MITIQQIREMDKREFAKFVRKLNKTTVINLLECNGIYVKTDLKIDELIDILLDVVEGKRNPKEEDIKKIARRKRMRETIEENRKKRLLEQQKIKEEQVAKEHKLEDIWCELNREERGLVYMYYCFKNGRNFLLPFDTMSGVFDFNKEALPYSFMREDKYINEFEEWELEDFTGSRKLIMYIHPDTCKNYKTYEFANLSEYINDYKNILGIGR